MRRNLKIEERTLFAAARSLLYKARKGHRYGCNCGPCDLWARGLAHEISMERDDRRRKRLARKKGGDK